MPSERPAISRSLARRVLMEAGHRCAIPTCRQTPVEIAHIEPYGRVKGHSFENLIALCPNCHARYDRREIDRKSMQLYKANLTVINSRYNDLERRILEVFAENRQGNHIWLMKGMRVFFRNLIADGLLKPEEDTQIMLGSQMAEPGLFELTPKGREFIGKWLSAEELE